MTRQLPDPRAIYDSRKRTALNAHLPDAGEALRRKAGVDPAAAERRQPYLRFAAETMTALLGADGLREHTGNLIAGLEAFDVNQAADKFFYKRRGRAVALFQALDGKADAKPEEWDELLDAILSAADSWLPRDPDKAATPPAEES